MFWKDSVVWNTMISGFGRAGFYREALSLFRNMNAEGLKLDSMTIPSVLSACAEEGDLMNGKEMHGQVVKTIVFNRDVAIGNSLIDMHAKYRYLHYSRASSNFCNQVPRS
ncbi:hypothetical protein LWI28_017846 [Acer negundo]|uniref:Pentatricopeptide repeat-containing protein n=1 Tax=Acer negundo TaxID=4023 RepID=A0AAD5IVW7_ACENE|nr:hypothetical protein LWI28_017846 [Acer negundo]KAK4847091.1 hypothetical protein QYF36_025452 [Acer negundo]